MTPPLVSIVIANWNGERFLGNCLDSVFRQGYSPFEVIVVDNGSTDGSVGFIRKNFPLAALVENPENMGFAAANNQGIGAARGKYVLTLNNDTELKEDFLAELVKAAEGSGKEVGMWAPKILSLEEPGVIDSIGGLVVYPDCVARGRGRGETDRGQHDGLREALMPSACAGLYLKDMLGETGAFDEDFFAYCEDTDLGLRARLMGWRALSVPRAVVHHHYSGTTGRYTPMKAYLVERNRIWAALKNLPLCMLVVSPFYTLRRYTAQLCALMAGSGASGRFNEEFSGTGLISVVLRAYIDGFKRMPAMLSKRRRIRKRRRIAAGEFRGLLRKNRLSAAELAGRD